MAAGLFGCDDGFCIDLKSAELDDPASGGTWAAEASMSRAHVGHTATALSSGWVPVAVGGTARVELYEPSIATWVTPGAAQHRARRRHRDAAQRWPGAFGGGLWARRHAAGHRRALPRRAAARSSLSVTGAGFATRPVGTRSAPQTDTACTLTSRA